MGDLSTQSEQMDRNDADSFLSDQAFDLQRVNVERIQLNVTKDRPSSHEFNNVGSGNPSEAWHNHFITRLQAKSSHGDVQGSST